MLALIVTAVLAAIMLAWALMERRRADAAEARALHAAQELAAVQERARNLEDLNANMREAFQATSSETLAGATTSLLQRAEEGILKPVRERLTELQNQIGKLETQRQQEAGGLLTQINNLLAASKATQDEARRLSDALKRAPNVRGRWGEQSLRNVLETCGLNGRFDFIEQATVASEEGRALRPDALVRLAGGGVLALDSKVNLNPYLDALEAQTEEERTEHIARYVRGFKAHVDALSRKAYWDQFKKPPYERSPGFVVMFVPGENFLCAALDAHPTILDDAREAKVLIASPTSLFALLQAVAMGWRAEDQAQNAQRIADLGRDLYGRIATMAGHIDDVGTHLGRAVSKYNEFIGSLKDRVLPQARKFEGLAADHQSKRIPELNEIDPEPRKLGQQPAPSLASPAEADLTV